MAVRQVHQSKAFGQLRSLKTSLSVSVAAFFLSSSLCSKHCASYGRIHSQSILQLSPIHDCQHAITDQCEPILNFFPSRLSRSVTVCLFPEVQ